MVAFFKWGWGWQHSLFWEVTRGADSRAASLVQVWMLVFFLWKERVVQRGNGHDNTLYLQFFNHLQRWSQVHYMNTQSSLGCKFYYPCFTNANEPLAECVFSSEQSWEVAGFKLSVFWLCVWFSPTPAPHGGRNGSWNRVSHLQVREI